MMSFYSNGFVTAFATDLLVEVEIENFRNMMAKQRNYKKSYLNHCAFVTFQMVY